MAFSGKTNRTSLILQEMHLKAHFPGGSTQRSNDKCLIWTHNLTPSHLGNTYKVMLFFDRNKGLSFYVLEPKLKLANGATKLPHVYSTEEQRLCLFDPKFDSWNSNMIFSNTIIPWASEWLLHYEFWVVTGEWYGGGRHVESG